MSKFYLQCIRNGYSKSCTKCCGSSIFGRKAFNFSYRKRNFAFSNGDEDEKHQKFKNLYFERMPITLKLVSRLKELGFEKPTPIQNAVIPQLVNRQRDSMLINSETGSGKSLCFLLPILNDIYRCGFPRTPNIMESVHSVIIVHSRELGFQIASDIHELLCKNTKPEHHEWKDLPKGSIFREILGSHSSPDECFLNLRGINCTLSSIYSFCMRGIDEDITTQRNRLLNLEGEPESHKLGKLYLFKPPRIIICTPVRMLEILKLKDKHTEQLRKSLSYLRWVVCDEAEEVLQPLNRYARDKKKELRKRKPKEGVTLLDKLRKLSPLAQFVFSSATLNAPLRSLIHKQKWDKNRIMVRSETAFQIPSSIKHYFKVCSDNEKVRVMIDIFKSLKEKKENEIRTCLVVIGSNNSASKVINECTEFGFVAEALHSGLLGSSQNEGNKEPENIIDSLISPGEERRIFLDRIKQGKIHFIITTEKMARGIHIENLNLVFVLNSMKDANHYLHVSGRVTHSPLRTGVGQVINLLNSKEVTKLERQRRSLMVDIERYFGEEKEIEGYKFNYESPT